MSWDDLEIEDLENIPAGYLVTWKFINAFLKAFQERADYIEEANRATTYDDIILDNAQIMTSVLSLRLTEFNKNLLTCFDNTTWLKQSTWDDLNSFNSGKAPSRDTGLGIVDVKEWDEVAIRLLLTDDVYDMIFIDYKFENNFRVDFWSGIYKLLKHVMIYRSLSIVGKHDPDPTEPYLVINGRDTFDEFAVSEEDNADDLFNEAVGNSFTNSQSLADGGSLLIRMSLIATVNATFPKNGPDTYRSRADCEGSIVTGTPFCKVPARMNIIFLMFLQNGDTFGIGEATFNQNPDPDELKGLSTETVSSTPTATRTSTDGEPRVYVPDVNTYNALRAENPKYPVTYDGERCQVDISSIVDIRSAGGINGIVAPDVPNSDSIFVDNNSQKSAAQSVHKNIQMTMCELPQDEFEFSISED